jgi:PAS domain S-box-containing protein
MSRNRDKERALNSAISLVILFSAFIFLCGITHNVNCIKAYHSGALWLIKLEQIALSLCAFISIATATASFVAFPLIFKFIISAEASVREKELTDVVNLCDESILILDSNWIVLNANIVSRKLFGEDIVGQRLTEIFHGEENDNIFESTVRSLVDLKPEGSIMFEYQITNSEEEEVWLESTLKREVKAEEEERKIYMITREVTERKRAEESRMLAESIQATENSNQAKLHYISCIAHDLKTPLQSFFYVLDLLKASSMDENQLELVEQAEVSVELMKLYVSQALQIGKALSGGDAVARKGSFSLSTLLQRVKIVMKGFESRVPIYYNIAATVVDTVISDHEWLWQMLLNLGYKRLQVHRERLRLCGSFAI